MTEARTALAGQSSHTLLVLSQSRGDLDSFRAWYAEALCGWLQRQAGVVSVQGFARDPADITQGRYPPLPYDHLTLVQLSVDGAEQAAGLIGEIADRHQQSEFAGPPATWIYFPISAAVGLPLERPRAIAVAFANAVDDRQAEFREWYATRHIRHALAIPAVVSGQCFERAQFQQPGAAPCAFQMIAIYQLIDTPASIIRAFETLPAGALDFPTLDPIKFAEWVYTAL
jgi:hypothetical protein